MRAIDADDLKTAFPVCDNSKPVLIASVRATINHMPTIELRCETCEAFNKTRLLIPQPQRNKGRWIYKDDLKQYFCSECGYPSLTYDDVYIYGMDLPNFCEECGADMREDAEEPKKCDTCKHVKEPWFERCADCSDYELWESKE